MPPNHIGAPAIAIGYPHTSINDCGKLNVIQYPPDTRDTWLNITISHGAYNATCATACTTNAITSERRRFRQQTTRTMTLIRKSVTAA